MSKHQQLAKRLGVGKKAEARDGPPRGSNASNGVVRPRKSAVQAIRRMVGTAARRETLKFEAKHKSDGKYLSQSKHDPKIKLKEATRRLAHQISIAFTEGVPHSCILAILEGRDTRPCSPDEAFAAVVASISRECGERYCENALIDAFSKKNEQWLKTVIYLREKDEEKVASVAEAIGHLGKIIDLGFDHRTGTRMLRLETELEQRHLSTGTGGDDWHKTKDKGTETPQSQQDAGAGTKTGIRDKTGANKSSASHIGGKSSQGGTKGLTASMNMANCIAALRENLSGRPDLPTFRGLQVTDPGKVLEHLKKLVSESDWSSSSYERKAALIHKAYENADAVAPANHIFISTVAGGRLLEFEDDSGEDIPYGSDEPPDMDLTMGDEGAGGAQPGDTVELPDGSTGIVAALDGETAQVTTIDPEALELQDVPVSDLTVIGATDELPPGESDMMTEPEPDEEDDEGRNPMPFEAIKPPVGEDYDDYMTGHDHSDMEVQERPTPTDKVKRHPRKDGEKAEAGDWEYCKDCGEEKCTCKKSECHQCGSSLSGTICEQCGTVMEDGTEMGTGSPAAAKPGTGLSHHDTDLGEPGTQDIFDIEGDTYSDGTDTANEHPQKEPGSPNADVHRKANDNDAYEALTPPIAGVVLHDLDRFVETLSSANSLLSSKGYDSISEPEYRRMLELHKAGFMPDKIMDQVEIPREVVELLVAQEADGPHRGYAHSEEPGGKKTLATTGDVTDGPQGY